MSLKLQMLPSIAKETEKIIEEYAELVSDL